MTFLVANYADCTQETGMVFFIRLFRLKNLMAAGIGKNIHGQTEICVFIGQHGDYYCTWGPMGTRKCYADQTMNIGSSPSGMDL